MIRLTPLALLGLMLVGCAAKKEELPPIDSSLHQATVEVQGMT